MSDFTGNGLAIANPVNPAQHPMRSHLWEYVRSKTHHCIQESKWAQVIVIGRFARDAPYIISKNEKNDKKFNWFRPTAKIVDENTILLACFPGRDYVQHYAFVIASYLALAGRTGTQVKYEREPDLIQSHLLQALHLRSLGTVDTVIVGYVDKLTLPAEEDWHHGQCGNENLFFWKRLRTTDGSTTMLLGCMFSFWGDISEQLIKALSFHGLKRFLYVGKVGTFEPDRIVNLSLATGESSAIDDCTVTWDSAFRAKSSPEPVFLGPHVTIASPLLENNQWIAHQRAAGRVWVDCEVGLMARECQRHGISFDYLHIVSDNLSRDVQWGLWNDDLRSVRSNRLSMLEVASTTIASSLTNMIGSSRGSMNSSNSSNTIPGTSAMNSQGCQSWHIMLQDVLESQPDSWVSKETIETVIRHMDGAAVQILLRRRPNCVITQNVVQAASENKEHGLEIMQALFRHRPESQINAEVISAIELRFPGVFD